MPYLLDNPELGFVQGRWTYLNQDESTFTRWIEMTLNQHIKGEQFVRSSARTFLQVRALRLRNLPHRMSLCHS